MGSHHRHGAAMDAPTEHHKRAGGAGGLSALQSKHYREAPEQCAPPVCGAPDAQYYGPPCVLPPSFLRSAPACPPWAEPPPWKARPRRGGPSPCPGLDNQPRAPPAAPFQLNCATRCALARNRRVGGGLPKEWCEYTTHAAFVPVAGLPIAGVLPCKTFLSHSFEDRLSHPSAVALGEHRERWRPGDAVEGAAALKAWSTDEGIWVDPGPASPRIAAVVNLTLTERYYDSLELEERGVEYYWFPADGGGSLPQAADIQQFLELFAYLSRKFPGRIIAMHCTHGVNRTGFYFSLLLMAFGGLPHSEAVTVFSRVRGHPINRENLIEGLAQLEASVLPTPEFQSFMQHLKSLVKLADPSSSALGNTTHPSEPLVLATAASFDSSTATADKGRVENPGVSRSGRHGGTNDGSQQEAETSVPQEAGQPARTQPSVKVLASYSVGGQKEASEEDREEDSANRSTDQGGFSQTDMGAYRQTCCVSVDFTAKKLRDVFVRIQLTHPQQIAVTKLYIELLRSHYCPRTPDCTAEANSDSPSAGPVTSVMPLGIVGLEESSGAKEDEAPGGQPVSEETSKTESLSPQIFNVTFTTPSFACTAYKNCILKLAQEIPRLKSGIVQLCTHNSPKN